MNTSLKLFNINESIESIINDENSVDPLTGEFSPEAVAKFESLQLERADMIKSIGLANIFHNSQSESVNNEIKRLTEIKKYYESKAEAAKKFLQKHLEIGEKFDFDTLKISWRKSEETLIDELLDLTQFSIDYPELVKIETVIKKAEIKALHKEGKPLPVGIKIIEKQNLQIK